MSHSPKSTYISRISTRSGISPVDDFEHGVLRSVARCTLNYACKYRSVTSWPIFFHQSCEVMNIHRMLTERLPMTESLFTQAKVLFNGTFETESGYPGTLCLFWKAHNQCCIFFGNQRLCMPQLMMGLYIVETGYECTSQGLGSTNKSHSTWKQEKSLSQFQISSTSTIR